MQNSEEGKFRKINKLKTEATSDSNKEVTKF